MSDRTSKCWFLLIIASVLLIYSCAKIGSPPGGPVDDQGPTVISIYPLADSVNILRDNNIIINFDEKVDSKSLPGGIFISPHPEGEIEYKWDGNALHIILPDSFAENTTYIVNLATQIRDIRNNPLDKSYSFAFSTGAKIATGKIYGTVFKEKQPISQVTVGLYYIADTAADRLDSLYPPYLTQTGTDGRYSLEYIPDGDYFILAFLDKNKDQIYNFPSESFGVPDRFPKIDSVAASSEINFHIHTQDTASGIAFLSAALGEDNLLKIRFNRRLSGKEVDQNLDKISLQSTAEGAPVLTAAAVKEAEIPEAQAFNFYFKGLSDGEYNLRLMTGFPYFSDSAGEASRMVNIQLKEDRQPPQILKISHSKTKAFPSDSLIQVEFSEPIEWPSEITEAIRLRDSSTGEIEFKAEWEDYFRLDIITGKLDWGKAYILSLNEQRFVDMAGNPFGDSLWTLRFSTYSEDSLGEISGKITIDSNSIQPGIPYLELIDIAKNQVLFKAVPESEYRFSVGPGKYFLRGFLDRNGNGTYDIGSFKPFEFSETYLQYPDTIRVRYRFETAGIDIFFK